MFDEDGNPQEVTAAVLRAAFARILGKVCTGNTRDLRVEMVALAYALDMHRHLGIGTQTEEALRLGVTRQLISFRKKEWERWLGINAVRGAGDR